MQADTPTNRGKPGPAPVIPFALIIFLRLIALLGFGAGCSSFGQMLKQI